MAAIARRTTADRTGVSPLAGCASYTLAVIAPRPRSRPLACRTSSVGRLHARALPRDRGCGARGAIGRDLLAVGRKRRGQDDAVAAVLGAVAVAIGPGRDP